MPLCTIGSRFTDRLVPVAENHYELRVQVSVRHAEDASRRTKRPNPPLQSDRKSMAERHSVRRDRTMDNNDTDSLSQVARQVRLKGRRISRVLIRRSSSYASA